jgi:hypothetical protein
MLIQTWSVPQMMMLPELGVLEMGVLVPLMMPGLSSRRCVVIVPPFLPGSLLPGLSNHRPFRLGILVLALPSLTLLPERLQVLLLWPVFPFLCWQCPPRCFSRARHHLCFRVRSEGPSRKG